MKRSGLGVWGRARRCLVPAALALLFTACAPSALVMVNPHYNPAKIRRVAVIDFEDYSTMAGSGRLVSGIFEKYLFLNNYSLVDRQTVVAAMQQLSIQPTDNLDLDTLRTLAAKLNVDAFVFGQVTDFTDTSEQTVVEDMTLVQDTPVYSQVDTVQRGPNGVVRTSQDIQTGTDISTVDEPVEQTETVAAHVGLAVRMVDAQSGELLWSASDSEDGPHLNDAAESVSTQIMKAFQASMKNLAS
ncbi:MAG TPA: hypothetical protein VK914_07180 [bacterium]|jgi:hypothetical protein|nr:hypothetical protein [bacterium]